MTDALPPADLLEHAAFVRRLAFHLLRDDAAADDVAQDAAIRALERPPRGANGLRGWFATVVRRGASNARRGETRRRARERVVARPEGALAQDDVAARAEIVRTVGDAVRSLDAESQRVVFLRHYEDLPPREIAARLGIPVETVRSRLRRAYERLRAHLDEGRGGNVEGWRASLAGLVGVDGWQQTAVPVGGGIAVATVTKVGVGLAGAALLGAGAWIVIAGPSVKGSESRDAAAVASTDDADRPPAPPGLASGPSSAPARAVPVPAAAPDPGPPPGWARRTVGRISLLVPESWDEQPGPAAGTGIWSRQDPGATSGVAFGVLPREMVGKTTGEHVEMFETEVGGRPAIVDRMKRKDTTTAVVALTDEADEFSRIVFALMAPAASWESDRVELLRILASVRFLAEAPRSEWGRETDRPSGALIDSLARPISGPVIEGTVLRGAAPAAGVTIELAPDEPGEPKPTATTVADAKGDFRFEDVKQGMHVLHFGRSAATSSVTVRFPFAPDAPPPPGGRRRVVVVLSTGSVTGRVHDRSGKPAVGISVRASSWAFPDKQERAYRTVSAADGTFTIENVPDGTWNVSAHLPTTNEHRPDVRSARVRVDWGETKRVDLGSPRAEALWSGVVRSWGGTPYAGPALYLFVKRAEDVENVRVFVDGQGRFAQRLPSGKYFGWVSGGAFATADKDVATTIGESDVVNDVLLRAGIVRGVVWDAATGRPAARGDHYAVAYLAPDGGAEPARVAAGADGAFAFQGVPAGTYRAHAELGPPEARRRSDALVVTVQTDRDVLGLRLDLPAR